MSEHTDIMDPSQPLDAQNKAREKALREKAQRLAAGSTGSPLDWDEFQKKDVEWEHKSSSVNAIRGAGIGSILLGAVGLTLAFLAVGFTVPLAVVALTTGAAAAGALGGAVVGSRYEEPEEIRSQHLDRYEAYLKEFERTGAAPVVKTKDTNAAELLASRQQKPQAIAASL